MVGAVDRLTEVELTILGDEGEIIEMRLEFRVLPTVLFEIHQLWRAEGWRRPHRIPVHVCGDGEARIERCDR